MKPFPIVDISTHAKVVRVNGRFHIPPNAKSNWKFVIPDDVVELIAQRYGLASSNKRGLDPMCGLGTIPRVLTNLGGRCDGREIDPDQYAVSRSEVAKESVVTLGDCTDEEFVSKYEGVFDYVYVSVPFLWFKNYAEKGLDPRYARTFWRLLRPSGMLLVDCDDVTTREGSTWPLASYEQDYYSANGFSFVESTHYIIETTESDKTDATFTELQFIKG